MTDAVKVLKEKKIVQLFEYCVHLDKNQTEPDFDVEKEKHYVLYNGANRHKKIWRSFGANYCTTKLSGSPEYDVHGHVGFAWGARRSLLNEVKLYDRALIGGADHIMAHAAAGHIPHLCIRKGFEDDIVAVEDWSKRFYDVVQGELGFVSGTLLHFWHGDITKRRYLKRVQEFTPKSKQITERDKNGLFIHPNDRYLEEYFEEREVSYSDDFGGFDEGFFEEMGYLIQDVIYSLQTEDSCEEENVDNEFTEDCFS